MTIITVNPIEDERWHDLIQRHRSDVFHSPAWIRAVMKTYGWEAQAYLVLDDNGQVVAGVPFCVIEDLRGKRVICFPFSDATDPLVEDMATWHALLEKLQSHNADILVRSLHNRIPAEDGIGEVAKQAAWHGMDLQRDIDDIWMSLSGSARRAIRKSEKSGVEIHTATDESGMRQFFELHMGIRKGKYRLLAQPYDLFKNIWYELVEPGHGAVLLATVDGEVVAGNVYLEWKDTLTYKFSASNSDFQNHRPTDALIWSGIKYGVEKGYHVLDFGLSDLDQPGLVAYKNKFATEEKRINFVRYDLDLPPTITQQQVRTLFPTLTDLFTDERVPDDISEKAGELLYKFFA